MSDGVVTSAQRSRRTRYCHEVSWAHDRTIQPGEVYVRCVAFPGHGANPDGPGPSALIMCEQCASHYPEGSKALARYAADRSVSVSRARGEDQ